MNVLAKFIRYSPLRKRLVVEALVLSAYYRYLIWKKPFKSYCGKIGTERFETAEERISDHVLWETKYAVSSVCQRTPWESKCLVQALTAKKILNRRGFPCTLYMGVMPDKEKGMVAHAWLRCGTSYITGGNGGRLYAVTAIYGDRKDS